MTPDEMKALVARIQMNADFYGRDSDVVRLANALEDAYDAGFTHRPMPSREQVAQRIDKILDGDCGYGVGEHLADAVLALFEKGNDGA